MKKSVIAIVTCFFFLGCSQKEDDSALSCDSKIFKVLATTGMIGDVVSYVGGDRIDCSVLIQGEIDPHSYELVKGDDEKIEEAALLFYNGLNLEHGASLQYKISRHPGKVSLGGYIVEHYPELILFEEGQMDPHIWMDISLWVRAIDPIVDALSVLDEEGREYYREKGEQCKKAWLEKHIQIQQFFRLVPESKRYLVTSHDAFAYFTRAYLAPEEEIFSGSWKRRFAAPEGLAPDGQLGALDLQKIVTYLKEYHVEVVFPESNVSRDSLQKIVMACREKQIPVRFSSDTLYGDCMGEKGTIEGTYLGMIAHDATVLIKEWKE